MELVQIIGWGAALLTLAASVPQTVKLLRTRDVEGVSLWTYLLWLSVALWWLGWGLALDVWPQIALNLIAIPLLATAVFLLRPRATHVLFLAVQIPIVVLGAIFAPLALQIVGSVLLVSVAVPSARLVLARDADLSGLAPGTWWLIIAAQMLWLVFNASIGHLIAATACAVQTALALVVIVQVLRFSRRAQLAPALVWER